MRIEIIPLLFLFAAIMVTAFPADDGKGIGTSKDGNDCQRSRHCKSKYCHHGRCDKKKQIGHACYKNSGCITGVCKSKRCSRANQSRPKGQSKDSQSMTIFSQIITTDLQALFSSATQSLQYSLLTMPEQETALYTPPSSVFTSTPLFSTVHSLTKTVLVSTSTVSPAIPSILSDIVSSATSSPPFSFSSSASTSATHSTLASSLPTFINTSIPISSTTAASTSTTSSSLISMPTQIKFTPAEQEIFISLGISKENLDKISSNGFPKSTEEANHLAIEKFLDPTFDRSQKRRLAAQNNALIPSSPLTILSRRNILPTCDIKDFLTCSNPTQASGLIQTNGCGASDSPTTAIFLTIVAPALFDACNNHDRCFGTCGSDFNTCNVKFLQDSAKSCISPTYLVAIGEICTRYVAIVPGGLLSCILEFEALCAIEAALYPAAVEGYGCNAYVSSQKKACVCKDEHQCLLDSFSELDNFGREVGNGHIVCTSPSCGGENLSPADEATCLDCFQSKCNTAFVDDMSRCDDKSHQCQLSYCPDFESQSTAKCIDNIPKCFAARGACYNEALTSRCKCNASCVGQLNSQCSTAGGPQVNQ